MEFYTTSELSHHGILGQKWGVRRYQNEDGSYTQAGLARYREAKNGLASAKRSGNRIEINKSKGEVRKAKDLLKRANKADKGRDLYAYGKTITSNEEKIANRKRLNKKIQTVAGLAVSAAMLTHECSIGKGKVVGSIKGHDITLADSLFLAGTGASVLSALATGGANAYTRNENENMRAYYHRKKDVDNLTGKKKPTPDWVLSEKPTNNSKLYKYSQDVLDKDANRKKYNI